MNLDNIMDVCKELDILETRNATDKCRVFVVRNQELGKWNTALSSVLGSPSKRSGEQPLEEQLDLTKEYGSIFADQTLFAKNLESGETIIAMFWPWQEEPFTTIKIYLIGKPSAR